MSKYLIETFYTCTFKIVHKLDELNDKKLSELENRKDGDVEILDVRLNNRKTKTINKKDDYQKYPRMIKSDILILKKLKVNYLYLPKTREIYPDGPNRKIKINSFGKKLCGKFRHNHFEAIADVVDRLIKIIKPKKIYFGEKDMQQLKILENFIIKNHINTKVIGCKTVREKNGIALSSRNLLLTKNEKKTASKIYKLIKKSKNNLIKNKESLIIIKNKILKLGAYKIDYLKILDINKLIKPFIKIKKYRIFVAYYLGKTRLIDNI